jgi:hypothetical protein
MFPAEHKPSCLRDQRARGGRSASHSRGAANAFGRFFPSYAGAEETRGGRKVHWHAQGIGPRCDQNRGDGLAHSFARQRAVRTSGAARTYLINEWHPIWARSRTYFPNAHDIGEQLTFLRWACSARRRSVSQ